MKTRAIVVLSAVAGFAMAAQAQDKLTWTWTWVHVEPGTTNTMVPAQAGIVSPGEAVEFRGSFSFTPDIGAIRTSQTTGLSGPVGGINNTNIDFNAAPGHGGEFYTPATRLPPGPGGGPSFDPDRVRRIVIGQFGIVGTPLAWTQTSFTNAARIRWNPVDYLTARTVDFNPTKSVDTQSTGASLLLNAGGTEPGEELWTSYDIELDPGATIQIQVVPSPSSLALLGLGGLVAARRRR